MMRSRAARGEDAGYTGSHGVKRSNSHSAQQPSDLEFAMMKQPESQRDRQRNITPTNAFMTGGIDHVLGGGSSSYMGSPSAQAGHAAHKRRRQLQQQLSFNSQAPGDSSSGSAARGPLLSDSSTSTTDLSAFAMLDEAAFASFFGTDSAQNMSSTGSFVQPDPDFPDFPITGATGHDDGDGMLMEWDEDFMIPFGSSQ